jgi:hypothetical protein
MAYVQHTATGEAPQDIAVASGAIMLLIDWPCRRFVLMNDTVLREKKANWLMLRQYRSLGMIHTPLNAKFPKSNEWGVSNN